MGAIAIIVTAAVGLWAAAIIAQASFSVIKEAIQRFTKAGVAGKTMTLATTAALGMGVVYGLDQKNTRDDQAYKYAYGEFNKMQATQEPMSPSIAACFKDSAAKTYASSISYYFSKLKASARHDVNYSYQQNYVYTNAGKNSCEQMIDPGSSIDQIKNARIFGKYLNGISINPILIDAKAQGTTGNSEVVYNITPP